MAASADAACRGAQLGYRSDLADHGANEPSLTFRSSKGIRIAVGPPRAFSHEPAILSLMMFSRPSPARCVTSRRLIGQTELFRERPPMASTTASGPWCAAGQRGKDNPPPN